MGRFLLTVLALCTLNASVHGKAIVSPRKQAELMDYMVRYGYLHQPDPRLEKDLTNDDVTLAVKNLQHMRGLAETGSLQDPDTAALVDVKRCAVPDFGPSDTARRKRRYAVHGTVWNKKLLTYRIVNYPSATKLKVKEVDDTIRKSLDSWSAVSQIKFERITDNNTEADIMISFVTGYHGDSRPADGPGKELAHAFFPLDNKGLAGDLHFDNDEEFDINGNPTKVDFNWLSLHELGHSLGLDHSWHIDSVMFPFYLGYAPGLKLDKDDVEGIQQLYGKPEVDLVTPTPHTNPTQPPGIPDFCSLEKLDAMVMTKDKKTYAFSGAFFTEVSDKGAGKVKKIKDHWPGLEDGIDAAVTRRQNGWTYFFKGTKFWILKNKHLIRGPIDITVPHKDGGMGLPKELYNMDAAVEWAGNGRMYFFKGEDYWRYNFYRRRVDYGYPKKISKAWLNVPSDLNAALQWKNGKTYFLKGKSYYALKRRGRPRVDSGYPKDISAYWMGCSQEGLIRGKISPGKSSSFSVLPNTLVLLGSMLTWLRLYQ